MSERRRGKTLAIVVLLCAASVASAFPTVISGNAPVCSISTSDDCATNVMIYCLGPSAACDQISELGRVMLQPPSGSQITVTSENQRCLPALPSAIAMVLTGFICISLIRDRRAWLAVLAGLLWVGQTGIWALPEVTSRLSRRVHSGQQVNTALAAPYPLGGCFYPDSYNEETRYAGLLHHLAGIPRDISTFTNNRTVLIRYFSGVAGKDTRALHHAILESQLVLSQLTNCLVSGTRQFVCFKPAFISFCQLPRGPPISAEILFEKPAGV
ncbi:MAG: hypothetical protein WBL85_10485 [Sedimentisphaerales bacterium]